MSEAFFERAQAVVDDEMGNNADKDDAETKRLRNFLLYCLAVDYRVPIKLPLDLSDREHYLEMAFLLEDLDSVRKAHLKAHERATLAPYFWKYSQAPCIRLGIPVDCAIAMVCRFYKHQNILGRYKGCAHGVLAYFGTERLAAKISMDRSILVSRLTASPEMRI